MEKYLIKKVLTGFFWNVCIWRKEWSESLMSNTTTLIGSKKFLLNSNIADTWIAKTILKDLSNRNRMEIYNNGRPATLTTSS